MAESTIWAILSLIFLVAVVILLIATIGVCWQYWVLGLFIWLYGICNNQRGRNEGK